MGGGGALCAMRLCDYNSMRFISLQVLEAMSAEEGADLMTFEEDETGTNDTCTEALRGRNTRLPRA